MNYNLISLVSTPVSGTDATNKNYVDGIGALKLNIDGTYAMTGALDMNSNNIFGAALTTTNLLALSSAISNTVP